MRKSILFLTWFAFPSLPWSIELCRYSLLVKQPDVQLGSALYRTFTNGLVVLLASTPSSSPISLALFAPSSLCSLMLDDNKPSPCLRAQCKNTIGQPSFMTTLRLLHRHMFGPVALPTHSLVRLVSAFLFRLPRSNDCPNTCTLLHNTSNLLI